MISVLAKALLATVTKMFMAIATQEMIEWLLFRVAGEIVKSTKTPHDDEFYAKLKELYDRK